MGLKGHCLCGQSTWEVSADKPDVSAHDHCDDCKRQSGSEFSWVGVFKKSDWKLAGPTKEYSQKADSGKLVRRYFCSNCGSPLAHAPDAAPDIVAVKLGTLDKSLVNNSDLAPQADVYGKDILPWVAKLKHFNEKMP